jgi:polar amino acid transport system substrate-binding protein
MGAWLQRRTFRLLLTLLVGLGWSGATPAQAPSAQALSAQLRVVTTLVPPFVMKQGDRFTGFSIDLWEEVARRLKLKSSYTIASDAEACIELIRSKNADIGVSGIFFTTERDALVDYAYPIMQAGLRVMVRDSGKSVQLHPFRDLLTLLSSREAGLWFLAGLVIVALAGHVVWLLDRSSEDGVTPTKSYFPGILHSMFWAATGLASQAMVMPKQWLARMLGLLWLFVGIVFVALFTAQLTASITVEQIRGAINGPGDLPGKQVGTLAGSTSAAYLRKVGANVEEFRSTEAMYQALLDRKVDAVLMGSATLGYYAKHEGLGRVRLVGPEIDKADVGFVVALDSPLRKRVSNALLALHEDGTYQRIYAKWFGSE